MLSVEKATEIVSNYKAGGAAADLANFFVKWEKHVGELSGFSAAYMFEEFAGHHTHASDAFT